MTRVERRRKNYDHYSEKGIPEEEVKKLVHTFEERGFQVNDSQGTDYHILGLIGDTTSLDEKLFRPIHLSLR